MYTMLHKSKIIRKYIYSFGKNLEKNNLRISNMYSQIVLKYNINHRYTSAFQNNTVSAIKMKSLNGARFDFFHFEIKTSDFKMNLCFKITYHCLIKINLNHLKSFLITSRIKILVKWTFNAQFYKGSFNYYVIFLLLSRFSKSTFSWMKNLFWGNI